MSDADPTANPGFEFLGERTVHQGYAIEVAIARYRGPDGAEFTRDVVHHPGAVAVVPLHDDGTVSLVRQFRAPIDRELLEIPAGIRDVDGEPLETTAARELAEETGLEAERIEPLVGFHNAAGHSDEFVHVFLATGLRVVADDRQGPEELAMTVERHPLDDLLAMIGRGEITDVKTLVGLLRCRER